MCNPGGPDTYERVVARHVDNMRRYASELDDQPAKIDRNDVVARIRHCADMLEATNASLKARADAIAKGA